MFHLVDGVKERVAIKCGIALGIIALGSIALDSISLGSIALGSGAGVRKGGRGQ